MAEEHQDLHAPIPLPKGPKGYPPRPLKAYTPADAANQALITPACPGCKGPLVPRWHLFGGELMRGADRYDEGTGKVVASGWQWQGGTARCLFDCDTEGTGYLSTVVGATLVPHFAVGFSPQRQYAVPDPDPDAAEGALLLVTVTSWAQVEVAPGDVRPMLPFRPESEDGSPTVCGGPLHYKRGKGGRPGTFACPGGAEHPAVVLPDGTEVPAFTVEVARVQAAAGAAE